MRSMVPSEIIKYVQQTIVNELNYSRWAMGLKARLRCATMVKECTELVIGTAAYTPKPCLPP